MCIILSWFGVHQSILHSWGDIIVLLLLWIGDSWGYSSVPLRKSRFLKSLIGNTELLSMKCRGIGPHLAVRGKFHEFSRVAACTWCIFSSYCGDGHLKLGFVQRSQDSCLVMTDTSWISTMLGRKIQTLLEVSREAKRPLLVGTVILVFLSIIRVSQSSSPLKHWTQRTSRSLKLMWGPLSRRRWKLWLSLGSPQGIKTSLHLLRWKMSLHLRHCQKSRPSSESGHLGVHYTWGRKHRLALIYLFLREASSSGACGKLAYLFSRRQEIILIPRWYGVHGSFLKVL